MSKPLHIISFGSSGAGKSHLQEKVAECMPQEDIISNTSLTGTALYYYDTNELQHKLLLFEDLDGLKEDSLYAWRELMSKRYISRSMPYKDTQGKTKTKQLTVHGPLSTAGCTTHESIYEDNANRCFLIYIDESKQQDKKVMDYQRLAAAGKTNQQQEEQTKQLLQNAQRLLRPIKIINPYAEYLQLPDAVFKPRRTNAHYLQFIEAITFYKQYQKQWVDISTGEILYDPSSTNTSLQSLPLGEVGGACSIHTSLEDIQEANQLLQHILLRKSDELPASLRNYLENIKNHLYKTQVSTFTSAQIKTALGLPSSSIKRYNHSLLEQGYLQRNEQLEQEEKKKGYKTHVYQLTAVQDYDTLQNNIINTLNTNIYTIQQVCSSKQKAASETKPKTKKHR
jgi:predicted transcriptional regulator